LNDMFIHFFCLCPLGLAIAEIIFCKWPIIFLFIKYIYNYYVCLALSEQLF